MKDLAKVLLAASVPVLAGCVLKPAAINTAAPAASDLAVTAATPNYVVTATIVTTGGPGRCGGWTFAKLLATGPNPERIAVRAGGDLDFSALDGSDLIQVNLTFTQPFNFWYQRTGTSNINNLAISIPPAYPDRQFAAPWPAQFAYPAPPTLPVSPDQKTLTFLDQSGNRSTYNFALQYYTGTQNCVIDPAIINGGPRPEEDDGKR